jgi:hypothetical protein
LIIYSAISVVVLFSVAGAILVLDLVATEVEAVAGFLVDLVRTALFGSLTL